MRRNAILLAICGAVALVVVWLQSLPGQPSLSESPAVWKPARPSQAGEFRGICLQLHDGRSDVPYETFLSQIARTGANTVCLVVHGYQENVQSTAIFIDERKTPDEVRLKELMDHAHRKGLRVMLMPVVLLAKRHGNDWRGKIGPDNWDEWWREYQMFILHFARVAQAGRAEIFSVGSELISVENQTDRWKKLIAQVRGVYDGRLTYSANWDHYEAPRFWSDLDIAGMTSYFTLAKGTSPTKEQLLESWGPIKKKILAWRKTINRPILFTEVGWPNQITAAEYPWNYYASPDKPDPAQQAMCFESFFETWSGERDVAGFLVWEWRNHPEQPTDPQADTSYRPEGKPAMAVIQKYFLAPSPWKDSGASKPASSRPKPE